MFHGIPLRGDCEMVEYPQLPRVGHKNCPSGISVSLGRGNHLLGVTAMNSIPKRAVFVQGVKMGYSELGFHATFKGLNVRGKSA